MRLLICVRPSCLLFDSGPLQQRLPNFGIYAWENIPRKIKNAAERKISAFSESREKLRENALDF